MHSTKIKNQQGFSLLESLIAILLTALGILGILGVQMKTLSNTQDTMRRVQSMRLIDDLSERLKNQTSSIANAGKYATSSWVDLAATIDKPSPDCSSDKATCTASELAAFEKYTWLTSVQNSLPLGQARIFKTADEKSLGVMLAWPSNDNKDESGSLPPPNAKDASGSSINCPEMNSKDNGSPHMSCHLQFISLDERCQTVGGSSYCAAQ